MVENFPGRVKKVVKLSRRLWERSFLRLTTYVPRSSTQSTKLVFTATVSHVSSHPQMTHAPKSCYGVTALPVLANYQLGFSVQTRQTA